MKSAIRHGCTGSFWWRSRIAMKRRRITAKATSVWTTRTSTAGRTATGWLRSSGCGRRSWSTLTVFLFVVSKLEYITLDIFNNSAWSYRFYVFTHEKVAGVDCMLCRGRLRRSTQNLTMCWGSWSRRLTTTLHGITSRDCDDSMQITPSMM